MATVARDPRISDNSLLQAVLNRDFFTRDGGKKQSATLSHLIINSVLSNVYWDLQLSQSIEPRDDYTLT